MITKIFSYKGQAMNYYKKVLTNKNIAFCNCGFDFQLGKYTVCYDYKK